MTNQERFETMLEDLACADDSQDEIEALRELLHKAFFQLDAGGEELFIAESHNVRKRAAQWAAKC